jgi:GT2 family glycosyltransferase
VKVTALLVSHDGARWLPAVLEGLGSQVRRPDRVLAVDTGSTDGSLSLLEEALGADSVLQLPAGTSFPDAVSRGLDALGAPPADGTTGATGGTGGTGEPEWLWLLHDDCRPDRDALAELTAAAAAHPSVDLLGPKLREWPSLRRLLEVGLTISGTGRRETGLERGEYDQGQHDRVRDVLAVSSAGMLVRREVLVGLGGFDPALPVFGNDLDLGWRAARAGHRSMVVPSAVCFHVEAAHRGLRDTPLTRHPRRRERRGALYTLLVSCAALALPLVALRLVLGSLLRAAGLLLVRAPREAADEVLALLAVLARPDQVLRGRRTRRRTHRVSSREVRHLLAPPWLPYRHGLDVVTDVATAVGQQAADVSASRRRGSRLAESGPVPAEAENLPDDTGLLARLASSPTGVVLAALVLCSAIAARGLLGAGMLAGGALLPAPASAGHWWDLYLESWHAGGVGSALATAPYVAVLAAAGTLLLGKAWLVVDLLFLMAVPLAAWGMGRLLRRLVGGRAAPLWGAVAYGLFPVLSGAVAQGRLGTVAAAAVLPWVAHAALNLSPGQSQDRRWRAAWRTTLLLALLVAFAPFAWACAVLLTVATIVVGVTLDARSWRRVRGWAPLLVPVVAVPVLLLPWVLSLASSPAARSWFLEAGLAAPGLFGDLEAWSLVAGRPTTGPGAAPLWIGVGFAVAALGALLPRATRRPVLAAWAVILTGLAGAVWMDHHGTWAGFPLLLAHGGAVAAVVLAAPGAASTLTGASFGWRQPVGLVVVAGAVLAPLAGLVWWVGTGVAGPLVREPAHRLPAYMVDAALRDPSHGVLVLRREDGSLVYTLLRGDGLRTGDDTVPPPAPRQARLTTLVGELATEPTLDQVERLSRFGVGYLYLPPPAPPGLVGELDAVSGLVPASAPLPGARGWELEVAPGTEAVPPSPRPWHTALLALQALALVVALVLAAPSRRPRR